MIEMARADKEPGKSGETDGAEAQAFRDRGRAPLPRQSAPATRLHAARQLRPARATDLARIRNRWRSWPSSKSRSRCPSPTRRPWMMCSSTSSRPLRARTARGFPIYVDPVGLQEAEKTLTSTVSARPGRHSRCGEHSSSCSSQLGLVYFVDDGILVITSQESGRPRDYAPPARALDFHEQAR